MADGEAGTSWMSWWEARPDLAKDLEHSASGDASSRQTGSKPTPNYMSTRLSTRRFAFLQQPSSPPSLQPTKSLRRPSNKHEPASEALTHEDASSTARRPRSQPTFSSPRFSSRRSQRQCEEQAQWAASARVARAAAQEAAALHAHRSEPYGKQQRHQQHRAATSRPTKVSNDKDARRSSTSRVRSSGGRHPLPRETAPQRLAAPTATRVAGSPASLTSLTSSPAVLNRSFSALDRAKLNSISATKAAAALEAVEAQLREEEERERAASVAGRKDRKSTETWRIEQRAALAVLRGSGDLSAHLKWDERRALWTALDGTAVAEATRGVMLW